MSNRVIIDQTVNTVTTDQCPTIHNSVVVNNDTPSIIGVTENVTNIVTIAVPGPQGPAGPAGPSGSSILNQITSGSVTASVNIGPTIFSIVSGSSTYLTISSSGSLSVNGNTTITGSLTVTQGITGSLFGTSSWALNAITASYVPASAVVGLNLSQISTGSVSASVSLGSGSFELVSGSTSFLFVSSSGNVGIGTTNPTAKLQVNNSVVGDSLKINGASNTSLTFNTDAFGRAFIGVSGNTLATSTAGAYFTADGYQEAWFNVVSRIASSGNKYWRFGNLGSSNYFAIQKLNDAADTIAATPLTIFSSTGNVLLQGLGTSTTDSTQRLQVIGDAFIKGSGNTSATTALLTQNSSGTETFLVRNDAAVKIGSGSFGHPANTRFQVNDISGNTILRLDNALLYSPNITNSGTSGLTISGNQFLLLQPANPNNGNVIIGGNITNTVAYTNDTRDFVFLNQNWNAVVGTSNIIRNALTLNNTINYTNATGTNIARGLYVNPVLTSVSDWRSIEWTNNASGSTSWGLYGSGSAPNYLSGSLSIGTTTSSATLTVQGNVFASSFTGSLFGTASWALNALTASFVPTSSLTGNFFVQGGNSFGTTALIGTNDAQSLALETNGSVRMFISGSNGYVGIGTSAPTYSLDIAGTGGNDGVIRSRRIIATGGSAGDPPITTNSTIAGLFEPAYANLGFSSYGGEAGRIETISRLWNIGMTGGTAKFNIRAVGSTGSTNALVVQNSTPSTLFVIRDDGNVGIGTTTPNTKLDVNGNTTISGSLFVSGSTILRSIGTILRVQNNAGSDALIIDNSLAVQVQQDLQLNNTVIYWIGGNQIRNTSNGVLRICDSTAANFTRLQFGGTTSAFPGIQRVSSSLAIVGADGSTTSSLLIGQTIDDGVNRLQVSGSSRFQGNMTVSGSLNVGNTNIEFQENTNVTSGSWRVVSSEPTASYKAAFFDYVMFSGSIARAGTVYSVWSASYAEFYENYTGDVGGSTSGVTLQAAISGSNIQLQATASNSSWTIRSLVRML